MVENNLNIEKIYSKHYSNKKVRISYHNSEGYEKVATGFIVDDTGTKIIVKTVMDEIVTLNYNCVDNVIELKANYKSKHEGKGKDGDNRKNQ